MSGAIPPLPNTSSRRGAQLSTGTLYLYFLPLPIQIYIKSRDRSIGIALGYRLDDRGFRIRFSVGAENFSLYHRV
jgi:hypothetical protein